MKWFLEVVYVGIGASYKWLLGMAVIIGVTVGALFAAGVLGGGGESDNPSPSLVSISTPTPTPTPTPIPTLMPTPTPTVPSPTPVPTAIPTPTAVPPPAPPNPTATPEPTVAPAREVAVPIFLDGAANVGSLEFVLVYEPSVLVITNVEQGALASNALLESSTRTPGLVWAGMIDANGISGDGPVVVVTFRVIGTGESTTALTLENVVAHDASSLLDIITLLSPGSFTVKDLSLTPPSLGFRR